MTALNCADLRRRAEESQSFLSSDKEWTVRVPQRELLALLDLAKRLEAALEEIAGHGCYRTESTSAENDCYDHLSACVNTACAALAAAKEAKL